MSIYVIMTYIVVMGVGVRAGGGGVRYGGRETG